MKQLRLTVLGLVLTLALGASSATYFCSPNGKGNGNSYTTPCSFATGIGKLSQAGDTLYLLGGVYSLGETSINKSGNATRYIVISGYPGEQAILDFRQTAYGTRGLKIAGSSRYLHIKNLTLRYSGKNNLYNEGSYCLFENLDIYGSADTGCQMKNGGNNIIKNVDSHHNFDYEHYGSSGADFGGNADGFADKQHSGAPNHYIGCRAWCNSDDGWDFFQRVTGSETIIENCICYQNGPAEYDMRNHARYQTDKAWFNQVNGTTITNRYGEQQVVTLEHYPNHGNGNGFKLGGGYTDHKVLVHHCLSVANTVRGFDQNNNDGTMRIYNNTGYKNGYNFGFTTAYGTLTIQNNISFRGQNADAPQSKTTLANDHNSWNSLAAAATDFLSLDTTVILAPRQANGDLAENTLLHLAAGSKFINAGVNVGLSFMGTNPDLGCYETDGVILPALALTEGPTEQWVIAGDSIVPVTITWIGCDTKPNTKNIPTGITRKVSNNNKTLTFTGAINTAGDYTITTTTACDSNNVSLSFTIHVQPEPDYHIAYVSTPGSPVDVPVLNAIRQDARLYAEVLDAAQTLDLADYDMVVLSPVPNSGTAGAQSLQNTTLPFLCMKPFMGKNTVWNWCTASNNNAASIEITNAAHPIFAGLSSPLSLYSKVSDNKGVVTMRAWQRSDITTLATLNNADAIVEFTLNTKANNTCLMIGLSEGSMADITTEGQQLIMNSIYYLLGINTPTAVVETTHTIPTTKILTPAGILIRRGEQKYTITGQRYE